MSEQIIVQPDGKLAVYSGVSRSIVVTNATPEEVVEWRAEAAAEEARRKTLEELEAVFSRSSRPYYRYTLTWEEACAQDAHTRKSS